MYYIQNNYLPIPQNSSLEVVEADTVYRPANTRLLLHDLFLASSTADHCASFTSGCRRVLRGILQRVRVSSINTDDVFLPARGRRGAGGVGSERAGSEARRPKPATRSPLATSQPAAISLSRPLPPITTFPPRPLL